MQDRAAPHFSRHPRYNKHKLVNDKRNSNDLPLSEHRQRSYMSFVTGPFPASFGTPGMKSQEKSSWRSVQRRSSSHIINDLVLPLSHLKGSRELHPMIRIPRFLLEYHISLRQCPGHRRSPIPGASSPRRSASQPSPRAAPWGWGRNPAPAASTGSSRRSCPSPSNSARAQEP
ncbi:uncharacterized protein LOC112342752 [Selaginella moellendorffii]|uniref:uncharacterized protein LOC112342752 n=1 Tax=Selaginella moellendorffii TaxID=88036 RepID=UPI000D1C4294|nr:uncharacterized protein LOC112342752 [Selaginella moellendorffii]|eukprot:XP_024520805.1 uncharacterized protein LOC112342752 [Selaginella moellendorffii]